MDEAGSTSALLELTARGHGSRRRARRGFWRSCAPRRASRWPMATAVDDWGSKNRRLFNTEKIIFEVYFLVTVEPEGVVAKPNVLERELALFNIASAINLTSHVVSSQTFLSPRTSLNERIAVVEVRTSVLRSISTNSPCPISVPLATGSSSIGYMVIFICGV